MFAQLAHKGIRLTIDAEELVKKHEKHKWLFFELIKLEKPFLDITDIQRVLDENKEKLIEVQLIRPDFFDAVAKDYEPRIQVFENRDVSGKSRTKGEVENFVNYFRDRYQRIAKMLRRPNSATLDISDAKDHRGEKARVIALILEKSETKKGNLMLEIEDPTGTFKVIVSANKANEDLMKKARTILKDEVIAITGKVAEAFMMAEDFEWPDLPVVREKKTVDVDLAVVYLSDLHFGSRFFLDKKLDDFVEWIHGRGEAKELASKVKYIVVAGDIADGIGVYPNQERELIVKDIYEQYDMFDRFVEKIPDHIEIIVAPGNHDAVRRGEPQPLMGKELIEADVTTVGNPSVVGIEGLKHLIYHGTSMDSMIANVPGLSYNQPEKVMVELLKRRHLSPIYGGNLIIPENTDYLVIEDVPDIFHSGHVHKNGYTQYRGTLVINSGTFQDRTDFQIKQGHIPTPARVPVYELKYQRLKTLDFNQ
ncbi:DNA-directed DNA polymerase II small subunit [Candidatus Micrarchaeota archaeon]|nr:DNA-directed DNA polymerase II small subunit [Candidatus Micrarchaeota archaeon]